MKVLQMQNLPGLTSARAWRRRRLALALLAGGSAALGVAQAQTAYPSKTVRMIVGFPAGSINVVTGLGAEAGAALSAHPGIGLVTFTGSSEVGALVQGAAARHHVPQRERIIDLD